LRVSFNNKDNAIRVITKIAQQRTLAITKKTNGIGVAIEKIAFLDKTYLSNRIYKFVEKSKNLSYDKASFRFFKNKK